MNQPEKKRRNKFQTNVEINESVRDVCVSKNMRDLTGMNVES